ncbi:AbrB family transcriptional regulator [Salipiger sp. H15]|uniref:AbrB family transcriptional regulator n=1 Tax=Alloyangia sp. H15 TaxID=3029062 RepID=A0AAU8APA4_9RHOB
MVDRRQLRTLLILLPAAIAGGWLWSSFKLPLGWLMGSALVTGIFAMSGVSIRMPKLPHRAGLVIVGASVGLTFTPEIAEHVAGWLPLMVVGGALGIVAAALVAPLLATAGGMSTATAYFSLLPGGVIEMARIGESHGGDRTTIAALHAIRVALVVGLLPLVLFALFPSYPVADGGQAAQVPLPELAATLAIGALGGWLGARWKLPAAWLLGAVLAVGAVAASGLLGGRMPPVFLAAAQVIVGIALGERFERKSLASIPRAIATGVPALLAIMLFMGLAAAAAATWLAADIPTLVLAFSIGGMAEMVLTAKALHQDVALVAAFQALRAVMVNAVAGGVWSRFLARRAQPASSGGGD